MPIKQISAGWVLETARTAYALGIDSRAVPVQLYWGAKLGSADDYLQPPEPVGYASFNGEGHLAREEYPGWNGINYTEPCLKLSFADGVRDVLLRFETASFTGEQLTVVLRDEVYPLEVRLQYRVHPAEDLIERWAEVYNRGQQAVQLERVFSAQLHFPEWDQPYRLTHLTGRWNDEFHLRRDRLTHGVKVLESRRMTTSHHHNPWFALDCGEAVEDRGDVWFGCLAWSGNWKLTAEVTDFLSTRINLGLNDWDFIWQLQPGEMLTTPAVLAGFTSDGFGAASRRLHDYIRRHVLPHGECLHDVLYNSWEATLFDVDEASQSGLAELAAAMGVELFVMDDGWFHGRNNDRAGLGDWWPDVQKFPAGLNSLIQKVNGLGMKFGLWVEPEMVNPDSDLYRAHPDWVLHFPTRGRTLARNQLMLNLARSDVQDHLIGLLDRLLGEHNIAFIKWDMNRNASEPGWPDAPRDAREVWLRYVQGLYRVWGELQKRHPQVIFQSCSGGGGRADLGILRFADQIWPSDNTGAAARLNIQQGFSQVFPANVMEAWLTDADRGRLPLSFRFHVSMCGALGVGGNLTAWSAEERLEAAHWIAVYKTIRSIVQLGDQYRLRLPQDGVFSAVQYMDKEQRKGVLFAFRTHLPEPADLPPLYLRGLDPQAFYRVEGCNGTRSGRAWMNHGLKLDLKDFQSALRQIERVD